MEKETDGQKLRNALHSIILNSLINNYAVERVAFGFEKPGDKAPIELYLDRLHLDINDAPHKRADIPGVYIDEEECIRAEWDYSDYVRDLFISQTERIFASAPKDVRLEREGEELPFLPRFREYLFGLLPLFNEVLNVQVEYDAFDVIPISVERATEYPKWQRFVTAILLKPLKSGSRINRYVKDLQNPPYYIRRLMEKRGNNYYLKPLDVNDRDYVFAVFSLMRFMDGENDRLLELKMRERER